MNELLEHGHQMQMSAWLLLAIYAAVGLLVLPRELRFLREAEPRPRRMFIFLDLALQVCVLLILLPCAFQPKLSPPLFIPVFAGFAGLWAVLLPMSYQRYIYTYRMLAIASQQHSQRTAELLRRGLAEQADEQTREGGTSGGDEHAS